MASEEGRKAQVLRLLQELVLGYHAKQGERREGEAYTDVRDVPQALKWIEKRKRSGLRI